MGASIGQWGEQLAGETFRLAVTVGEGQPFRMAVIARPQAVAISRRQALGSPTWVGGALWMERAASALWSVLRLRSRRAS